MLNKIMNAKKTFNLSSESENSNKMETWNESANQWRNRILERRLKVDDCHLDQKMNHTNKMDIMSNLFWLLLIIKINTANFTLLILGLITTS